MTVYDTLIGLGVAPVRLAGSHNRSEVTGLAHRLYSTWYPTAPPSFDLPQIIAHSIIAVLEGRAFANPLIAAAESVNRLKRWQEEAKPESGNVIVIPRELLDSAALPDCVTDRVPIEYHRAALTNLLLPILSMFPLGVEGRESPLSAIGLASFPHLDVRKCRDLSTLVTSGDWEWIIEPDQRALEAGRERIEIELASLEAKLPLHGNTSRFVRVFLMKLCLAAFDRGRVMVWHALKDGDVVFLQTSGTEAGTAPGLYWCKFGSISQIAEERRLSREFAKSAGLRPYLYTPESIETLEADYTAALLSRHEGEFQTQPRELGEIVAEHAKAGPSSLADVVEQLDIVLDYLHVEPVPAPNPPRPSFLKSTAWKYNQLLFTKRGYVGLDEELPLKSVGTGKYRLLSIRPRDARREVEFRLLDLAGKNLMLLSWRCDDWRWRLWRGGIIEGIRVNIVGHPIGLRKEPRRAEHIRTAMKIPGVDWVKSLNTTIRDQVGSASADLRFSIETDLFPAWLHGDFHPRNILFVPNRGGPLTVFGTRGGLKLIDMADAVIDAQHGDDAVRVGAPMAFDLATFEVDLKARSLFPSWKPSVAPMPDDLGACANELRESEVAIWDWCRHQLPHCWRAIDPDQVGGSWSAPTAFPELPKTAFGFVALWRHFALWRLHRAALRAQNPVPPDWTAARSYAQALFLHSVGYLEYLDGNNAEDRHRTLTCLSGASVAFGQLGIVESDPNAKG